MRSIFLATAILCCRQAAAADNTRAVGVRPIDVQPAATRVEPVGNPVEHNAALFVGVNQFKYAHGIRPLNYAVDDAVAQAYLFVVTLKLVPPQNCYIALSGEPTSAAEPQLRALLDARVQRVEADRSSLIDAIENVRNIPQQKSDMVVVSFSTHGFEYRNEPYVLPSDGRWGDQLSDTALSCKRVEELVRSSHAGKRLILVDACQDRPGNDGGKGVEGVMTAAFLQAFGQAEGQAVFNSCNVGQVSYEDPNLSHGVFTSFLLKALEGEAGRNKDGFITVGSVSDYVSRSVKEYVVSHKLNAGGPPQTPYFAGPGDAREIPLAIDPGIRSRSEDFRASIKTVVQELKLKINDDGDVNAFTSDLYGPFTRELKNLKFDESGQEVLANVQSFLKGAIKEDVFVSYARGLLAQRAAEARRVPPFKALEEQAELGDASAAYRLANLYARGGEGVQRDEQLAMKLYRRAAEADNVDAMTELGRRYSQEYSTGIDYAEAFRWLKRAADAGEPKAMVYLGQLYEKGRGAPVNLTEAASRYAQAEVKLREQAKTGDADVMYALGFVLALDASDPAKQAEGHDWLVKSADAGNPNAMLALGLMSESGAGAPQDDQAAFKYFNDAAQRRSPYGMYKLANCYAAGRGTQKSPDLAVDWYNQAAQAGYPSAAFRAGKMFELGDGVAKNDATAQSLFHRGFDALQAAAERGDSASYMYDLAESLANGWPIEKRDPEAATIWYFKAANRGDTRAAQRLGDLYAAGNGAVRDDAIALDWYRRAGLNPGAAQSRLIAQQQQK